MLVFFAVVVVKMHGGNQSAKGRETFFEAFFFRQFRKVRVADVKVEAQPRQARLLHKGVQISRIAHLARGVLHANGYAYVAGVQNQMFQ